MREFTVRIRFKTPCLGDVRSKDSRGRILLPKDRAGRVMFLATWHQANMKLAAKLLGRLQDEVTKILWDVTVEAPANLEFHRRYYTDGKRQRYVWHEAIMPGQIVSINCAVPPAINESDLWSLMDLAGRYKGISPFKPGEFGLYEIESIRPRRFIPEEETKPETGLPEDMKQNDPGGVKPAEVA